MEQMTYSEYRNLPLLPLVIQWRTSPNFKSQQTKRLLMLRLLYICSWTFMAALCLCIRVQFIQDLWDVSLLISAAGILWICVKQTQFIKKKCDTYNSLLKICSEFKAKEKRVLCCSWCDITRARWTAESCQNLTMLRAWPHKSLLLCNTDVSA